MDNVNKPVAISVAATVIVCIAAVTLLVLLGGLAWWLWAMDRATQWETLRPLIATGFIIWGMALSLLVLGFMAFRLLIKDKVKPSAAPVRQPTRPAGREALYAPLKKHLHARYRLRWRAKSACCWLPGTMQQSNNWCLACVSSTGLKATAPC